MNRRLIRPSLAEVKDQLGGQGSGPGPRRKPVPPEMTAAEAYYYVKQMQAKTPMVVVFNNGEEVRGHIEWYDKNCIKVHRNNGPNLLIYKAGIKYLYKDEDALASEQQEEPEMAHATRER
ncbi:MAG: hypothetical protein ACE5HB_00880 [Terriglobia bacterium]